MACGEPSGGQKPWMAGLGLDDEEWDDACWHVDDSPIYQCRLHAHAEDMKADLERFVALCDEVEREVPQLKSSGFGHAAALARKTLAKVKGGA